MIDVLLILSLVISLRCHYASRHWSFRCAVIGHWWIAVKNAAGVFD